MGMKAKRQASLGTVLEVGYHILLTCVQFYFFKTLSISSTTMGANAVSIDVIPMKAGLWQNMWQNVQTLELDSTGFEFLLHHL